MITQTVLLPILKSRAICFNFELLTNWIMRTQLELRLIHAHIQNVSTHIHLFHLLWFARAALTWFVLSVFFFYMQRQYEMIFALLFWLSHSVLWMCVCIVLLYTVIYTHTTHSHFRFVILRFVSALVKCSWPIDKKFEKLGDKNTPSQRKLLRALADFVLIVQLCGRPSILREQDN